MHQVEHYYLQDVMQLIAQSAGFFGGFAFQALMQPVEPVAPGSDWNIYAFSAMFLIMAATTYGPPTTSQSTWTVSDSITAQGQHPTASTTPRYGVMLIANFVAAMSNIYSPGLALRGGDGPRPHITHLHIR
jgi:hypothetical protein